jgi:large subunit ribosomal protein L21
MMSAVRREETQHMYAVVETGGKQYSATPGGTIDVEKLPGEAGEQITLDQVLLIVDGENVTVGRPTVAGATVTATVVGQRRHRKVLYFHYVPKKRERKRHGHRQPYTRLHIDSIQA